MLMVPPFLGWLIQMQGHKMAYNGLIKFSVKLTDKSD
jgi:hypothetical protein